MHEIEKMVGKYNSETDQPILDSLKQGRVHKRCACSQCRLIANYFYLKKGGTYSPDLLRGLGPSERSLLMNFIFLRAIRSTDL